MVLALTIAVVAIGILVVDMIINRKLNGKEWLGFVLTVLGGSILGGVIVFVLSQLKNWQWGNIADWISGIGSVMAIVMVSKQISQQERHHRESHEASLSITIGEGRHLEQNNGIKAYTNDMDLTVWAVNTGNVAGAFQFLGFASKKEYDKAQTDDEKRQTLNSVSMDLLYFVIHNHEAEFERIDPKGVSKMHREPLTNLKNHFPDEKQYVVGYMDSTGKLYTKVIDASQLIDTKKNEG